MPVRAEYVMAIHLSTYSMTMRFSTYFISIDPISRMKKITARIPFGSYKAGDGAAKVGGTGSRRFAEDGGTSSSPHILIWAFALSARMERL